MKRHRTTFAFLLLLISLGMFSREASGEASKADGCTQGEASQFDFWVGDWDLTWGKEGKGRNVIEKILDGCVIIETFDGTPSMALRGMSVSSYNAAMGKWQQTWVDNQGNYLDFAGEFKDSTMVFVRKATIAGKDILQRMVWYEIRRDGFLWNWERSEDGGNTWTILWKITYTRRK